MLRTRSGAACNWGQVNNLFDRVFYTRLGGTNTYNWFGEPRNASVFLCWFIAG